MNMFYRFFMSRSLKSRIRFLYTLFAVVLVGIITFYSYHYTLELLMEKEASILDDSIEYLEKEISARINYINEEYINCFNDDTFLRLYMESEDIGDELLDQVELNKEFQNYFLDIKVRNTDLIRSIQMVASDGKVYADEYLPRFEYGRFMESPYYSLCMENKNKILYRNPEPEEDYFCIARSFYFMDSKEDDTAYPGVGYASENDEDYSVLIFLMRKQYLRKMIREEAQKRQTNILILDQDGNAVVQVGEEELLNSGECQKLLDDVKRQGSDRVEIKLDNRRFGVHSRTIGIMKWDVVYIYDTGILYRQAEQIRNVALVIFVFAVAAVFLIASFISQSIVKPIQALAKSMDEAVENHMEVSFEPKYDDEIAVLGRKFSAMMERISALMGKVKQAEEQKRVEELKALQAQINPHFLYNTLDMVYWMAKFDNNESIANLVTDLADFFRLSLNKGEDLTSVKREVEHVRKYLEIQKVRMDGKFDYEITTDPSVEACKVPKLILQPFAENVLIHGFEKMTCQGRIVITVSKEEDKIVFCMEDNGCGIGKELLEKLNRGGACSDAKQGYAIGNVRDRIQLYAGDAYDVWFDPAAENGTRVKIWFPYKFQEDEKND